MRNAAEIKKLIVDLAASDARIRAVLLNGSRANPTVEPDTYQDFDVSFVVVNVASFTTDHNWVEIFGELAIQQRPDEMTFGTACRNAVPDVFRYLMLFKDGNRIDLTLHAADRFENTGIVDSLTVVWLDKDHHFANTVPASDKDYHITRPTQESFADTCNEFWWVCTSVSKGLLRNEVTFAKEMLETIVRLMFMKVLEWKIGISTDFSVSLGKGGKYMQRYLATADYEKILATYADDKIENNWTSLFLMIELFSQFSKTVATALQLSYNEEEAENVKAYLKQSYTEQNRTGRI